MFPRLEGWVVLQLPKDAAKKYSRVHEVELLGGIHSLRFVGQRKPARMIYRYIRRSKTRESLQAMTCAWLIPDA